MATCNDCLHYDVCAVKRKMNTIKVYINGKSVTTDFIESVVEKRCKHFKDKSRYIELPCKVGDVMYQVTRNFISEFRVRFVEIATCGNLFLHTDLISGIVYTGEVFSESDIGKTVFLTREEAEKALEDMRKEDEG